MRHRTLAATGLALVLAAGASLPAAAQLPGVDVPEVEVPDVRVPEVTVPDVGGVDVPEVKVPPVQVPSVQAAPGVETPAVEVGGVEAGGSAPAPAPATGGGGSSGGGSTAGGGGGGSASGGGSGGGGSSSSGSATGTRATAGGGSAGAAPARAATAGGGGSRASAADERDDAPRSRRVRERRLRRLVIASRGCLGALPATERRVLVLRAGLGPRDPRSRRATAARLDLPLDTVRRRERAGLRELRALGGSCGAATGASTFVASTTSAAPPPAAAAASTAATAADGASGRDKPAAGGVLGESESSGREGGTDTPATVLPGSLPSDGGDASLFVLAGLAATLLALLANRRSREWILHPED